MAIDWIKFPRSHPLSSLGRRVVEVFEDCEDSITSNSFELKSDDVLALLSNGLIGIGFEVENAGESNRIIRVPVFFGEKGKVEKTHELDAYNEREGYIVEVEAGAGVSNNRYLVDLMKACTTPEAIAVCIAVRKEYKKSKNYKTVVSAIDTIYTSGRLALRLREVLIVGY